MSGIPVGDSEPLEIHLDATVKWKKTLTDYPASDGWQLSYYIRGRTGSSNLAWGSEVTQDGSTDDFTVTVAAAKLTGDSVSAGKDFRLFGEVTKGSEKAIVYNGPLEIKEDVSALSGTYDPRTHAKKTLDAIEATLEGTATREEQDWQISFGGVTRQLRFFSREELLAMRRQYRQEVRDERAEEDAESGRGSRRIIKSAWRKF